MAAGDFDSGSFFFFPLFSQLPFVRLCFLSSSSFFCLFVYLPCVTALSLEKPLLSVFVRGLFSPVQCPFSPCDEEKCTVLASPFEIGSPFLLYLWLAFYWFLTLFFWVQF